MVPVVVDVTRTTAEREEQGTVRILQSEDQAEQRRTILVGEIAMDELAQGKLVPPLCGSRTQGEAHQPTSSWLPAREESLEGQTNLCYRPLCLGSPRHCSASA